MDRDEKDMIPTTEEEQEIVASEKPSNTPPKYDPQAIAQRIAMQKKRKEEEKKEKRNRIIKTVGGILAIIIVVLLLMHSCGSDRVVTPGTTEPTISTEDPTKPIEPTDDNKDVTNPGGDNVVHTHEYKESIVEATCLDAGYTIFACDCGDTYKDNEVEALGHDYEDKVIAPTCTAKGYTSHTCKRCKDTYKDKETNAVGHKYSEKKTAPTCTTEGYTTYTCKCGHSYKGKQIPAYGHNYKETVTKPTYEAGGYTTHTCIRCNDSYKDDYTDKLVAEAPHSHSYVEKVVAATCETGGYTEYNCDCGHSYKGNEVAALGHNYKDTVTQATCITDGYTVSKCDRCGDEQKMAGDKAYGHAHVAVTTDATCENAGYTTHTCARCGDSFVDGKIDAYGHEYVEAIKRPTCTTTGHTTHVCGRCGDTFIDNEKPALGHTYEEKVIEATCTAGGHITHTCGNCGDSYVSDEVGPLGHNYIKTVFEMTHENDGYTEHFCERCGDDYKSDIIPSVGHTYVGVTTPPTCMEKGYTTHTCSCGDSYVDSYVDALGHDYQLIGSQAPTCIGEGSETYKCSRCENGYVTKQAAKGHTYIDTITQPTCSAEGYTTHTCEKCGDSYVDSYVDALECDFVYNDTFEPTCKDEGYTEYKCFACGETKKENFVPKLEHDYVVEDFKIPSCTEQGYTKSVCINGCGEEKIEYSDKLTREMIYASIYGTSALKNAIKGYTTLDEITLAHPNCVGNAGINIQVERNTDTDAMTTVAWGGYEIVSEDETSFTVKFTSDELGRCTNCMNETHVPTVLAEKCKYCGAAFEGMAVNANNQLEYTVTFQKHEHDFKETVKVEPTCDEDGYIKSECECGAVKEEYPKGEHNYIETVVPPTKGDQGYTEHVCDKCGDAYKDNIVDPLGYGNLLLAGVDFNAAILEGTHKVIFTDAEIPEGLDKYYDLSAMKDNSVIGWYETETIVITPADPENGVEEESVTYTILYVASADGKEIIFNEDCSNMFAGRDLISIEFKNITTAETKFFTAMFKECVELTELDLTTFDVSFAEEMSEMFYGCANLKTIKASGSWDIAAVKIAAEWIADGTRDGAENMFTGCVSLVGPERAYNEKQLTSIALANRHGYFTYELPESHEESKIQRGAYTIIYCTEVHRGFQDNTTIYYPWSKNQETE